MYYGIYNTKGLYSSPIKGFLGLNRKKKGNAGECVDCKNVSGDEFPVLRSIPENLWILEQEGISKMLPPDEGKIKSFTGVADGKLYIDGVDSDETTSDVLKSGESYFFIPDGTVYNTRTQNTVEISKELSIVLASTINFRWEGGGRYELSISMPGGSTNYSIYRNKKIMKIVCLADDKDVVWKGSENEYFICSEDILAYEGKYYLYITYCKKNEAGVFEIVQFEPFKDFYTGIGQDLTAKKLYVYLEEDLLSEHCTIHQNRAWCGSMDGSKIMVSKQGILNSFSDFSSGAASSWYCEVGSDGKFTGITSYNDAVYAFKEECVHVIYGNIPANFSMDKTFNECGCIDGRSIIIVNNALYWLGYGGIYRYAGGTPKIISDNLNRKYKECISFSDNRKLYLNLTDYDGNHELISYDTEKALWHKHKYSNFLGGFMHEGRLYAYTKSGCYEIRNGGYGEWFFESVIEYNDTFSNHSAIEFFVRAELKAGSSIKVEYKGISESDWENCGEYIAEKDEMIKERFIARLKNDTAYQYRLSGVGEVYIYELEKGVQQSGKKNV